MMDSSFAICSAIWLLMLALMVSSISGRSWNRSFKEMTFPVALSMVNTLTNWVPLAMVRVVSMRMHRYLLLSVTTS